LTNAVAVAYSHPTRLFVISTDPSSLGIGAILQEFQPRRDQPDKQELRTLRLHLDLLKQLREITLQQNLNCSQLVRSFADFINTLSVVVSSYS
jgi:hypothetical protein